MSDNAKGNLQMLAQRVADYGGMRYAPEHWPHARPLAEHLIRRYVPSRLGSAEEHGLLYYLLQPWEIPWSQLPGTLTLPARAIVGEVPELSQFPAPPPIAPPGSPQTEAQLRGEWTTDQAAAASVAATQARNADFFNSLADSLSTPANPRRDADSWLWVAAGVGVIGLLLLLKGAKS